MWSKSVFACVVMVVVLAASGRGEDLWVYPGQVAMDEPSLHGGPPKYWKQPTAKGLEAFTTWLKTAQGQQVCRDLAQACDPELPGRHLPPNSIRRLRQGLLLLAVSEGTDERLVDLVVTKALNLNGAGYLQEQADTRHPVAEALGRISVSGVSVLEHKNVLFDSTPLPRFDDVLARYGLR